MAALSTAISENRVSAIVGYEIQKSLEGIKAGNLPQRICILAEANTANQVGLPSSLNFTSAKEVGEALGYGSPAYLIARILRPITGDLLGGIPTVIYPVVEASGGVAKAITIGITGTATKNTTHKIKLAGREQLDGTNYTFVVETGDTAAEIAPKMIDAINNAIGCPAIGTVVTDDFVVTSKWKGITSNELNIVIDVQGESAGLTYSEDSVIEGAGIPSIGTALGNIGEEWNTLLINGIGSESTILDTLEADNGNPNDKTGRYEPSIFKPYGAFFGDNSVNTLSGITDVTDDRKNECTNSHCPAPNSLGFSFEAPANVAFLYGKIAQDNPQTDPIGLLYPDMPTAEDIGDYSDPSKREQIIRVGGSTVKINSSQYEIIDLATTYHPTDEPATATFFRWVRDIVGIDFNIKYNYALKEESFVVGKTIIPDGVTVSASDTISPTRWKGVIFGLADSLQDKALIADAAYMKESIQVQIGESNPNRFETSFKVQRTGVARVLSTTNETQFKFGG